MVFRSRWTLGSALWGILATACFIAFHLADDNVTASGELREPFFLLPLGFLLLLCSLLFALVGWCLRPKDSHPN